MTPGSATSPQSVNTIVPGDESVPAARNSSAPCARIHVTCARVSTLLTSVGLARSPRASPGSASVAVQPSCGAVANRPCWNGGRTRGSGSLPSMTSSSAFSSPNRYSSGPRAIVTSRSPSRPAPASSRVARSSASHSRTNDAFTPMYTSCASTVNAAIAAPVTTWYGSRRMIERSLNVPGSPSAPFDDDVVPRSRARRAPCATCGRSGSRRRRGRADRRGRARRSSRRDRAARARSQRIVPAAREEVVERGDRVGGKDASQAGRRYRR